MQAGGLTTVAYLGVVAQVYAVSVVSDDVLGAGILRVSARHQLLKLLQVKRSHDFWECHILGYRAWHTHLHRHTRI